MEVFEQKADDNKYLHKDFHISMNMMMEYICNKYGDSALTEYLRRFTREFHSILKENLKKKGLIAVSEYLADIYEKEEWDLNIRHSDEELVVRQTACPGITHIKEKGHKPVQRYIETYTTVYEELCADTAYEYKMVDFDTDTGACVQVFRKRGSS